MPFDMPLAEEIWGAKYRFRSADAEDADLSATLDRVAEAVARAEKPSVRKQWRTRFREALSDFRFIPAGRILAGAGTGRNVTLFNCFVMGTIPDNLSGIFEHLREAAVTLQQGGGVGMDFSTIRPAGAAVRGVGAEASGPLSFMDTWDAMCRTIMSAGQRRGAMMGCLRIDHPDIEAFIDAKRDGVRLRNFNLSVLVTDAFMVALERDGEWTLQHGGKAYRTLPAADLWNRLMRATYDAAEPGVIFVDRVNALNNLAEIESIAASNPCGEQMLPPYGACLLGSLNLAQLVASPFTPEAGIDAAQLEMLTETAVRFLDNVIDISRFPLEAQEREATLKRRIGLGITGLADALIFCGARYGSAEAAALAEGWLETIKQAAYRASARLAAEKGPYPAFTPSVLDRPNLVGLDREVREMIATSGLRNACLTSIAPTGTTSLLAGNISSGIEPVFAFSYTRKITQADGSFRSEDVTDHALARWRAIKGDESLPADVFVSAQTLPPDAHLTMQAIAQRHVDSSISKTVNCPADISFEAFKNIYRDGFQLGCKGLTTYRPNAITGAVLSTGEQKEAPAQAQTTEGRLAPRPAQLAGATYKLKWPPSAHAVYVTINDIDDEQGHRPFEVFVNSKNMDHYAWTLALTRMISAVFRRGGDVSFVAEELQAVFDPQGGTFMAGRYVPSLPAAIGRIIAGHLGRAESSAVSESEALGAACCPKCGQRALVRKEGCDACLECGHSKCG